MAQSNFRNAVEVALPYILEKATELKNRDKNNTGGDDRRGAACEYAAALLMAVLERKTELPKPPCELL